MEKEVFCYLYCFEVEFSKGTKKFYFESKNEAEIARFFTYKAFDRQRLTIKGFIPPVSRPKKVMIKEKDLHKVKVFSSFEEFQQTWLELIEEVNNVI